MKTINNLRYYLPVLIFSILFVAATIEANAQRGEGWKKNEYKHERYEDRRGYDDRHYKQRGWEKKEYSPKYNNRYKHYDTYCYEHPRYGRVYERFDRSPVVFHHDHDDYYYYGNHFYTYRRGIGYCVVEPPRNVYFRTLPVECERVYVGGHLMFRNGDLFFQLSPRGYVMASAPVGIHISASF